MIVRELATAGSSPRLWGTQFFIRRPHVTARFIPTPVGNTIVPWWWPAARPVHPHACGEHPIAPYEGADVHGSSPRLWGTLVSGVVGAFIERFIPTPVGNTSDLPDVLDCRSVHPHACGEHIAEDRPYYFSAGSSPRLWGTLCDAGIFQLTIRFIPTPVGNTDEDDSRDHIRPVHPHACGEHPGSLQRK